MVPNRILLGPGPSNVHPNVLEAMSQPLVGHLDPWFLEFMDGLQDSLRRLFQTKNKMTLPISGTGSAGMETCFVNLIEPGDAVLICKNGVFGNRMEDVARRCHAYVEVVEAEWGKPIDLDLLQETVNAMGRTRDDSKPKIIAVVHAETSTGVRQEPLEAIGKIAQSCGALFLVDAVTSLGGIDVQVDNWGIDAIYSGTQKCLSAPPGLSPVSFSPRAMEVIKNRKTKPQSWYLDVGMLSSYWGEERVYHHTAPITALYGLKAAVDVVLGEGLGHCFARHLENYEILRAELQGLGFSFIVDPGFRLPQLNVVKLPEDKNLDEAKLRSELLHKHNIEVGGGLGKFKGKIWRIGLMGYSSRRENVIALRDALLWQLRARYLGDKWD